MKNNKIQARSAHLTGAEVSWFAPICNGDTDFMGEMPNKYKSNWKNASKILLKADKLGFRNILCPSSYQVGQDTWTFASAVAPKTKNINLIISSNLPGENMSSADRYQRSREVIDILKQGWTQDYIDFKGQFYNIELDNTAPLKTYQQNGGPLLYFGGYSPPGVDLCAEHCDTYLMWPETEDKLQSLMEAMSEKAAGYNRKVDFGLRVHVIVRETEQEAKAYAAKLMSKLDAKMGKEIRERALDAQSYGVARQAMMRDAADLTYYHN